MPVGKRSRLAGRGRPAAEEKRAELRARRERKERHIREQEEAAAGRVSYVKKPLSARSRICLALAAAALVLGFAALYPGVMTRGQAALYAGALGLCSLLCGLVSAGYGLASFREKDRKYILARLGLALDLVVAVAWVVIIIIGARDHT